MAIMIAGLAIGAVGSIAGAAGKANAAKAQASQAEVNRRWQEYETQYNLNQQRGAMGLSEMQRILGQNQFQRDSMGQLVAQRRAVNDATKYANTQYNRQFRSAKANVTMSMNSRGSGRGGTADALQAQLNHTAAQDSLRIKQNGQNQIDALASQRNAQLMQIFGKPQPPKPPTYFPSSPIPMPDTSGMMMGAVLGSIGGAIGSYAGAKMAATNTGGTQVDPGMQSGGSYMNSMFPGGTVGASSSTISMPNLINSSIATQVHGGASAAMSLLG